MCVYTLRTVPLDAHLGLGGHHTRQYNPLAQSNSWSSECEKAIKSISDRWVASRLQSHLTTERDTPRVETHFDAVEDLTDSESDAERDTTYSGWTLPPIERLSDLTRARITSLHECTVPDSVWSAEKLGPACSVLPEICAYNDDLLNEFTEKEDLAMQLYQWEHYETMNRAGGDSYFMSSALPYEDAR